MSWEGGSDPEPFCFLYPVSIQSYLQRLHERQLEPSTRATGPHSIPDLGSDCSSTVLLTTPSHSDQT